MKWKTLSKTEADNIMKKWTEKPGDDYDKDYGNLREGLKKALDKTLTALKLDLSQVKGHEYDFDLYFGMCLYALLSEKNGFTLRHASDDGVWRYLSIRVVPDIVFARWGMNPGRFWREPRRMWLKTLWWYVHLSWQGDYNVTYKTLKNNTTDEIVQLVERSGPLGYRVELCRAIMKYYGEIPVKSKSRTHQIFRRAMKLNTAKTRVVEPSLLLGGEKEYVKELFNYFD